MNEDLKEFLSRHRKNLWDIKDLKAEISRLEDRCSKTTAVITSAPGGSHDDVHKENGKIELADKSKELARLELKDKLDVEEIEKFLGLLSSRSYQNVLLLRYIDLMTWDRIAVKTYVSERQVYKVKAKAEEAADSLWKFRKAMNTSEQS